MALTAITFTKKANGLYEGSAISVSGDFYLHVEASESVQVVVKQKPAGQATLNYTHSFALDDVKKWGGVIKNESPISVSIVVEIRFANTKYNGSNPVAYYAES